MTAQTRRDLLTAMAALPVAAAGCPSPPSAQSEASAPAPLTSAPALRPLGKTGALVERFSLGGEGILRTHGREREAVPMILAALELGVRYLDTAPAYASSQDYYGAAFREAGATARDKVFLATKTHYRERDRALRLLDDSLGRLRTDRVDLWQLHDLRSSEDLDAIFAKGGAIEAAERARSEGRARFIGVTGHHDPAILVEALRRYSFDTVLCAINPADPRRAPFLSTVVAEARARGVGVIGMKALAVGRLVADGVASAGELIGYASAFADTVIVGCSSVEEVRRNVASARGDSAPSEASLRELEARVAPTAARYDTFKA